MALEWHHCKYAFLAAYGHPRRSRPPGRHPDEEIPESITPDSFSYPPGFSPLRYDISTSRVAARHSKIQPSKTDSGWRRKYSPKWFQIPLKSLSIPNFNLVLAPPYRPPAYTHSLRHSSSEKNDFYHFHVSISIDAHVEHCDLWCVQCS